MNNKLEIIKLALLAIIALCLVIIVIQGFGGGTRDVYVRGGDIDAYVRGNVSVDGSVSVDNTVDVNLYKINNQRNVFFNNPKRGDNERYYVIPVTVE